MATQQLFQGPVSSRDIPFGVTELVIREPAAGVYRRVGELEDAKLNIKRGKFLIEAGMEESVHEEYVIKTDVMANFVFREQSMANLADQIGHAKATLAAIAPAAVQANYALGDATVKVVGDMPTAGWAEGDIATIYETVGGELYQETFVIEAMAYATYTTVTLPTDGKLKYAYTTAANVKRVAGNTVGMGGLVTDLTLEAVLYYTRPNGDHWSTKIHKMAVPDDLELVFPSKKSANIPVNFRVLKDTTKTVGQQYFLSRHQKV